MTTNYTVPPNFGELVRAERLIRGWSMIDLQNRTGLHENTISRIERGITKRPRVWTKYQLALALGNDPLRLLWQPEMHWPANTAQGAGL